MKIGMMFANVMLFGMRDGARALAEATEESGIESLWTVEHVVVPARRLEDIGVHRLVIPPPSFDANDIKRALGEVSEKIVAKV